MNIQRVVSDLVATHRSPSLAEKSLRVVEDHRGDLEVALDPVGAKPGDFVITISTTAARIAAGDRRITTDLTIGGIIDHWSEERWHDDPLQPRPVTPDLNTPTEEVNGQ